VPFPFAGVVPNGVDTHLFVPDGDLPLSKRPLLMTGRIVPEKGFTEAISVARATHERLMIVGEEYQDKKASREYFEKEIKPAIDGKTVLWESIVKQEHLVGHYQTAKALLFPIQWAEPFGLVMIEALACGTPVVAYDRGSVSEIIRDGVTGFIVEPAGDHTQSSQNNRAIKKTGLDGLVEAVQRIGEINRKTCRTYVEKNFSLAKMVEGYEEIYHKVID
jgi:glycosyltransferase involved in cell wall biosynthesis